MHMREFRHRKNQSPAASVNAWSAACVHSVGTWQVSCTLHAQHYMDSALGGTVGMLQGSHTLQAQYFVVIARGGRRAAPVLPGLAILGEPARRARPQLRWHVHVRVHPCVRRSLGRLQGPACHQAQLSRRPQAVLCRRKPRLDSSLPIIALPCQRRSPGTDVTVRVSR